MRAFTLDNFDTPPGLLEDLPAPTPADNEVLVLVRTSSVNGADGAIAAGMLGGMVDHEFPVVLGRDYAGVVEQGGSHVRAIPKATRSTGSCRTPTRPSTTAAGPS